MQTAHLQLPSSSWAEKLITTTINNNNIVISTITIVFLTVIVAVIVTGCFWSACRRGVVLHGRGVHPLVTQGGLALLPGLSCLHLCPGPTPSQVRCLPAVHAQHQFCHRFPNPHEESTKAADLYNLLNAPDKIESSEIWVSPTLMVRSNEPFCWARVTASSIS